MLERQLHRAWQDSHPSSWDDRVLNWLTETNEGEWRSRAHRNEALSSVHIKSLEGRVAHLEVQQIELRRYIEELLGVNAELNSEQWIDTWLRSHESEMKTHQGRWIAVDPANSSVVISEEDEQIFGQKIMSVSASRRVSLYSLYVPRDSPA